MTLLWVLLGVGIGVAATVVYLTTRSIVPPILGMDGAMGRLAGGDHSVAVPATDKKDEIGLMAKAVLDLQGEHDQGQGACPEGGGGDQAAHGARQAGRRS